MTERSLMAWFAAGHFAIDWPIAALWLIVPAAGLSMSLSPAEVGLLFTLFSVGGALAYLPAGLIADRVSNRSRLFVGTFSWVVVGYALAAVAPGFWSLAILLALAGMGNAAWHPIATGILTSTNKATRARALGMHAVGGSFAEVFAPLSVGLLLSALDWRGALALSVLPTVLIGVCFLWVVRAVPVSKSPRINRKDLVLLLKAWRGRKGVRLIAMVSLYNMAMIALLSMIPLYLAKVHTLSPAKIGIIFAVMLIVGALAQPWVGAISDKLGRISVLATGNGLATLAIGMLVLEPPFWFMIAAMAFGVASLDAVRAVMLAATVDHSDRNESTTLGFAFTLLDGIGAVGAALAGIAAGISWGAMFGLSAGLAGGAAILAISSLRGSARPNDLRSIDPTGGERMTIEEAKAEHARRYWFL
ncbi:MFS transporter [Ruegeria sp. R13_0]|uniref:MFS transporter n=1 Tax=Ruegeria sp. R13_0 TaxID=2821099 RepID=UPI001ADC2236|nr:MFS transporter [Ruegeria sp. R13_0]MBO9436664.1 MFS transporter [Ruegeria sp. R13_0]